MIDYYTSVVTESNNSNNSNNSSSSIDNILLNSKDRLYQAIGITDGYIQRDKKNIIEKHRRESYFPLHLIIYLSSEVDIYKVVSHDKYFERYVKNTITGISRTEKVLEKHENYNKLNISLQGIFILSSLDRLIGTHSTEDSKCYYFNILKQQQLYHSSMLCLNLYDIKENFNDMIANQLLESIPKSIRIISIKMNKASSSNDGAESICFIPSKLNKLEQFILDGISLESSSSSAASSSSSAAALALESSSSSAALALELSSLDYCKLLMTGLSMHKTSISSLKLINCDIHDNHIKNNLIPLLLSCENLKELDLSGNDIGQGSLRLIDDLLTTIKIESLSLFNQKRGQEISLKKQNFKNILPSHLFETSVNKLYFLMNIYCMYFYAILCYTLLYCSVYLCACFLSFIYICILMLFI